jgi:hypothetical protein
MLTGLRRQQVPGNDASRRALGLADHRRDRRLVDVAVVLDLECSGFIGGLFIKLRER